MNEITVAKYLKFCETAQLILLAFPSLYVVKSGFSHVPFWT